MNIKETIEYLLKLIEFWVIVQPWEAGIRVRLGKKIKRLTPGIYLRLPFIDSVYVQTIRLRVVPMPLQTVQTKDGRVVSIICVLAYQITDIEKLYNKLFHPETTITNIVLAEISKYISSNTFDYCFQSEIENNCLAVLKRGDDFGLDFKYVKVIGFATVRTLRLLQDHHWQPNSIDMDAQKK